MTLDGKKKLTKGVFICTRKRPEWGCGAVVQFQLEPRGKRKGSAILKEGIGGVSIRRALAGCVTMSRFERMALVIFADRRGLSRDQASQINALRQGK